MSDFENLSIDSLIRIYNYYQNEKGYGWQIIRNNFTEIFDMKDNFNWSDKQLMKFIKFDGFKINSNYLVCSDKHMESINNEKNIRIYIIRNILNDDLSSELKEIVDYELEINRKHLNGLSD